MATQATYPTPDGNRQVVVSATRKGWLVLDERPGDRRVVELLSGPEAEREAVAIADDYLDQAARSGGPLVKAEAAA